MEEIKMRIKRTLQPYVDANKIKFGFGNIALERDLEYSLQNVELVKKLDSDNIQSYSEDEKEIIDTMCAKGLMTTNNYDDSKFSRNINFFEWVDTTDNLDPYVYQKQLINSTVLIVGVGGIGSTVMEILARMGVGNFIIVDFDKVEESNLTRQSGFKKNDIGKYKTEVIKKHIEEISDSNVIEMNKKIEQKSDLEGVFANYQFDIAVCCADTPRIEIDYWFDDLAHKYASPFIAGSYASTVVNYLYIVPGKTISLREFYKKHMISDDHILENYPSTSVIAPISYMSAALIAYKIFTELTGLLKIIDFMQIDCIDWKISRYEN